MILTLQINSKLCLVGGQAIDVWREMGKTHWGRQLRHRSREQFRGVVCLECDGEGAWSCEDCESTTHPSGLCEAHHCDGGGEVACPDCEGEGHFYAGLGRVVVCDVRTERQIDIPSDAACAVAS